MMFRKTVLLLSIIALSACQGSQALESTGNEPANETDAVVTASVSDGEDIQPGDADGEPAAEADGQNPETETVADEKTAMVAADGTVLTYRAPAKGTVFTWRNNWASLPPVIGYVADGEVVAGGRKFVRFKSVEGLETTTLAYYDAENFALKGYRDGKDRALTTFKPVEERYRFPMKAGDQWVMSWKMKDHQTGKVSQGGGIVKVIGMEKLRLPAGTFDAMKVRLPVPPGLPRELRHHVWFAPELGVTVKEQIGGGKLNWTQILEKVELPTSG